MKKSLKRIVSLALVMAVLMTSMLVGTVGAASTNPMQEVILCTLDADFDKAEFVTNVLDQIDTKDDVTDGLVRTAATYFDGIMQLSDIRAALEVYAVRSDLHKATVNQLIKSFTLEPVSVSTTSFSAITSVINEEFTGDASDPRGIQLFITILKTFDDKNQTGAYATDDANNNALIDFKYDTTQVKVNLAIFGINMLLDDMQSLQAKLTGNKDFDALIAYTEGLVNGTSTTQIAEFKKFLGTYGYYTAATVTPSGGGTGGSTPAPVVVTTITNPDIAKAFEALTKADPKATGLELNAFQKALATAIEKEIVKVGSTSVTPTISGTTASVTADQIKVADIVAKAEAVIAKAAELAKQIGNSNIAIEKKVVLAIDSKGVATVNVALPTDLLTKVQAKGIETIELSTGDAKLDIATDFAAGVKDSKSVSFQINKVTVTDEQKAKMNAEQKTILEGNPTVYDFNAAMTSATGTETKITNFDKAITIKLKYTLKAGETKDKITVLYLADDGSIQNMVGRYDEATGEVVFVTKHFSSFVVKNLVKTFDDVTAGAWYKTQAESLAAKGIVEGREGNNFVPKANITRAEFLTMLVKAKGVYDSTATCNFTDVSKDAWYYTYVASAVKAGIAGGVGDNKFSPSSLITREQMAVMIANALGTKTLDNASSYLTASDASKIAAYAKNGMALSVKNAFMVGSDNKLDPKSNANRGMAAVVVYKYFNFIF